MKKAIAILLTICLCMGLCACGGSHVDSAPTPTERIPTQEELEIMYQQAKDYEANARFDEAIKIYRTLYQYGFADPDYRSKSLDEALAIREHNYVLQGISCRYFEYALWNFNSEIVKNLKDPDSLKIYSITLKEDEANADRFKVVFDYGAANSFGGMVRDTYEVLYKLTDKEAARIYQCGKKFIDSNGCTIIEYLVGNYYWCTIYHDTQTEAIINGTATYSTNYAENSIPDSTAATTAPTDPTVDYVGMSGNNQTISAGRNHAVALKSDGTVVATGDNTYGQCNVSAWTDIISVSAGWYYTVGLKADGTVVAVGLNEGLLPDGTTYPLGMCNVSEWTDIIAISAGFNATYGVKTDGTVVAVGGYNNGVSEWSDIIGICEGNGYLVGLRSDGTVVAVGSNQYGECDVSEWTDVVDVAVGARTTVGLRSDGTILVSGFLADRLYCSEWSEIVDIGIVGPDCIAITEDHARIMGQSDRLDSNYVSISASEGGVLLLKADGTVETWTDEWDTSGWTNIKLPN